MNAFAGVLACLCCDNIPNLTRYTAMADGKIGFCRDGVRTVLTILLAIRSLTEAHSIFRSGCC
jgi:hypothetical protein